MPLPTTEPTQPIATPAAGPGNRATTGPRVGRVARAVEVGAAVEAAGAELDAVADRLDVELLDTREAAELAKRTDRLARRVIALRTELVGRAAEAGTVTGRSGRPVAPERWATDTLGMKRSQANDEVRTAERLRRATKTRKAFLDALDLANHALTGSHTSTDAPGGATAPSAGAPAGASHPSDNAPAGAPSPSRSRRRAKRTGRTTRWGGARPKVIIRVDHTVLARGHALPGERCDIQVNGGPPAPLTLGQLHHILHHDDPMIAFVLHDGIDVYRVAHPQRPPSPLQRTALQALHDRCAGIDCRAYGNLEINHLTPWTDDGPPASTTSPPLRRHPRRQDPPGPHPPPHPRQPPRHRPPRPHGRRTRRPGRHRATPAGTMTNQERNVGRGLDPWQARKMDRDRPQHRRPRVVLVTGAPGSGKSTLGRALAQALRVPFLARDDVRGGLFRTAGAWTDRPGPVPDPAEAVEAFLSTIEVMASLGVSCVAEYVLRRHRPADLDRLTVAADCRVLLTHCEDHLERYARRAAADPLVARPAVLAALGHRTIEEHTAAALERMRTVTAEMQTEFDVPTLRVATDDGYRPGLDVVVRFAIAPGSAGAT